MVGRTALRYCWRILREAKVRICDTERREIVNAPRRKHMSLHPQPIPAIPEETARVGHTILPQGNVSMQMRDELGTLYQDEDFPYLFPTRGQPAQEPWRLPFLPIMQNPARPIHQQQPY